MSFQNLFNVQPGQMNSAALDQSQAEELAKTMTAGHSYLGAPTALTGLGALQMESIDGTLKSVTYDATNLVFWPSVPQDKAYSLVEQYVRTNSYGDGGSPYIPEAGSPSMNDSEYNRHAQKVVFFATRRGVSLPATMVKTNFGIDQESIQSEAGTLWMLEKLERELYFGNAHFADADGKFSGSVNSIPVKLQNLNLAGTEQQIRNGDSDATAMSQAFDGFGGDQSVISDMQGQVLDEESIEVLANIIVENFGSPKEIHGEPRTMSDFIKAFYPKERVNSLGVLDGRAGYIVKTMATTAGDISLKANVFLRRKESPKSQSDRAGVPNSPVSATATVSAGESKFVAGDSFAYAVTACNEQGEGSSFASASAVIVNDGEHVSIAIAQPAGGAAPTHYAIYRTSKQGAGQKMFVGYIARTGSTTTFRDIGSKVQGSSTAFLLDMRAELIVWKQLCPLMKLNLAQVSMAKEFILWLSGCLILAAPRKLGLFTNIGRAS